MIQTQLDQLIATAMKAKDEVALRTYRAIKTAFMKHQTAKNATPLDEVAEITIIKKMHAERADAAQQYSLAGRIDLASEEIAENKILFQFLPEEVSEKDVKAFLETLNVEKGMQNMGKYMKELKAKFPLADGKMLSSVLKSML